MEIKEIREIVQCLPTGRTLLYYFRDRYAVDLLQQVAGAGRSLRQIRQSRFARLLDRPPVRQAVAQLGSGRLTSEALADLWPPQPEAYVLTLGLWGPRDYRPRWRDSYYQTSRPGCNLVLQLNFSGKHDRPYAKLVGDVERGPYESYGHPINRRGRHTLAWARLDVNLDSGEALIEEIQSDWVRDALADWRHVRRLPSRARQLRWLRRWLSEDLKDPRTFERYIRDALGPHVKLWQEAMLFAALWFLQRELGLDRVFYHTWASGCVLKGLTGSRRPPRSLYTQLPRKFCFEETTDVPDLLRRAPRPRRGKRKDLPKDLRFFRVASPSDA